MRVIALVSTLLDNVKISMIGSSTCNHNHYRENNSDKNRRHEMTKNQSTLSPTKQNYGKTRGIHGSVCPYQCMTPVCIMTSGSLLHENDVVLASSDNTILCIVIG